MHEKSCGFSTKSSSNFLGSPFKSLSQHKGLKLDEVEERQAVFLREKNRELQELVLRMGEELGKLSKQKQDLLALNSKYIDTVNKQFKQNHHLFQQYKDKTHAKNNGPCRCKILAEFEDDYRSLVKHCINLEDQIKTKNSDLNELQEMRGQLLKSNHTSITELLEELVDTTHQLISLKRTHNQQQFQIQKLTQKWEKSQQASKESQKAGSGLAVELETYKSLINTISNEAIDKENQYKTKIYSLELTIERLQRDAREQQNQSELITSKHSLFKAERIQLLQGERCRSRAQSMRKVK